MKHSFELISFPLCPFVQRSVITLLHKKAPFTRKDIDLEDPPAWFDKLSPLGKVPVLVVTEASGEKTVLFESAVINEFIDEVVGERLLPSDPLERAKERAWIEFGSELLMQHYTLAYGDDEEEVSAGVTELFEMLSKLEASVSAAGPFFRGRAFSLVDTSYAPLFSRMKLTTKLWADARWAKVQNTRRWAEKLATLPETRESVKPTFDSDYRETLDAAGSTLA